MEKEAKKEAFRKYLDSSGVLDAMTKVLVALYEKNDKPASAVDFIQNKLGGPTLSDYEKLQAEKADLQIKYAELLAAHQDTCRESLLSGSNQSHSSSSASTSSLFPSSESASFVEASGSQFGISSSSAPTFGLFNSSSSGSLATVLQASAPGAKSSASDTCFGISTSLALGSGSALSSIPVSSTSNIFGVSSTQLNSNSNNNSFNSRAPVSATASTSLFGSNSQIASSTNTVIFSSSSQSSGSGSIFSSHSQATASNSLFGYCSQLAAVTSLLGSGSQPASSAGLFGSSSQPASRACLFGSQPATSTSSTFGLKPGASPVFGVGCGSSISPLSGFSFSSSGNGALAFGSTSTGVSSGSSMFFNSSTTSSGSFPAPSSVFSMSNQPVSFGSTTIQNDQMNVEDSMAEDTVQASNGIPNPFGQLANAPSPNTWPFVFGSPAFPPGAPVFQLGGHQNAPSSQPPCLISPPVAPTGSFSLGRGSPDKSCRRIVKVRRDKPRKK